jgi:hypothetical protein
MALLSTYTDLQDYVAAWAKADDLTSVIVGCIQLAEARLNRSLRVSEMEAEFASVALVDGSADLPADFLEFKELRFDGARSYTLLPKSLEYIRSLGSDSQGNPDFYAISGETVVCYPAVGDIAGTYYQSIPALASNSTNWLLTKHPDLYLFATLVELGLYTKEDAETMSMWASKATALIRSVQQSDEEKQFGGILQMVRR